MNAIINAVCAALQEEGFGARLSDFGTEIIITVGEKLSHRQPALGVYIVGTEAILMASYGRDQNEAARVDLSDPNSIKMLVEAAEDAL